jgi:hypothetical protein
MTEAELDAAYTHLCKTMTELGETRAPLFLARFALLAMVRIGDTAAVQGLIDSAAADIAAEAAS